jgi:transketolase
MTIPKTKKIDERKRQMKFISSDKLSEKARHLRNDVMRVACANQAGHIAPSLSSLEILVALYYKLMNINDDPLWKDRDRFIISKAHGSYAYYAILTDMGFIERKHWENFYSKGYLSGCVERCPEKGIEASTGALGHGLPIAVGIAFGAKLQKEKYRVYCLVGDGEMQEGSNWEAIQFAVKHQLANLTIIIDHNKLQAMDFLENILTVKGRKNDLKKKLEGFGMLVRGCNGHHIDRIIKVISHWKANQRKLKVPQVLIADTVKGHGFKCMENIPKYHFRVPMEEEISDELLS